MEQNQASITAKITAFARAYHAKHDNPKIFDDFLAAQMFSEAEYGFIEANLANLIHFLDPEKAAVCPDQTAALAWVMRNQTGSVTLSRSRYTEDCLPKALNEGVKQYIILGAGMDTFAFRHPKLLKHLEVFEVDHPATQTAKRLRLGELGWEIPPQLHFVPVDFSTEDMKAGLGNSDYDSGKLSFFSWLGVICYLERGEVVETLRAITDIAPAGSSIVFDYFDEGAFDPEKADKRMQQMQNIVKQAGEPMKTGFEPSELGGFLAGLGFQLRENLSPEDIEARFFKGTDGYHANRHAHFAWAVVG